MSSFEAMAFQEYIAKMVTSEWEKAFAKMAQEHMMYGVPPAKAPEGGWKGGNTSDPMGGYLVPHEYTIDFLHTLGLNREGEPMKEVVEP